MKKEKANNLVNTSDIPEFLKSCIDLKPDDLVISDTKWKYLVRSVLRGKNVLMVGPTGCAKTLAAQTVANKIGKPDKFFYFNLGSTQDARSALIGNTSFKKDTGTLFNESTFVKALRTENAIILLDEISRAHHDAINILMTVLDPIQRYLRLDEKEDSEVVKIAQGVTFIATANIGVGYTATRIMDRALLDRFPVKIEMLPLAKEEEFKLMVNKFKITDEEIKNILNSIIEIASHTRDQIKMEDGKLTNFLSTRSVLEMTELLLDGFDLLEIADNAIYPNFASEGGADSERTYVKQLVQKYIPSDINSPLTNDPLKNSAPF
jgi:MoxR-like ATPase